MNTIALQPDIYSPFINDNGEYIDKLPCISDINTGIRCLCGTRKNQIYNTRSSLNKHFCTEKHKDWLKNLNLQKGNHYKQLMKSNEIIEQQKKQITELKKTNQNKDSIIANLCSKIDNLETTIDSFKSKSTIESVDLLDIENL